MRNQLMGGGVLAAGLLLVLGLVFVTGQRTTPSAEAQTSCDGDDVLCVVITKETVDDEEGDFSFTSDLDGDFELGAGESQAITLEPGESITVSEDEAEGWTIDAIECDDDGQYSGVGSDSITVDFADFDEEEDEFLTVTCTFLNQMDEEEEATATTTAEATTTGTTTPEATGTTTPDDASAASTATTTAPSSGTPVITVPTVQSQSPSSTVEAAGVISPPTTGSGGLK